MSRTDFFYQNIVVIQSQKQLMREQTELKTVSNQVKQTQQPVATTTNDRSGA